MNSNGKSLENWISDAAWLDPGNQATAKLKELLKPCPARMMAAHPVSTRVNTPRNDEAALLEPLESAA